MSPAATATAAATAATPAVLDPAPEYLAFERDVLGDLAPVNVVERFFAARAASLMWRLQRLQHAAAAIDRRTSDADRATAYDYYDRETPLDRLARPEQRLQGMLTTTLRRLRDLQHDRRDGDTEKLQNKPNPTPPLASKLQNEPNAAPDRCPSVQSVAKASSPSPLVLSCLRDFPSAQPKLQNKPKSARALFDAATYAIEALSLTAPTRTPSQTPL
jgi:hypothetical protein